MFPLFFFVNQLKDLTKSFWLNLLTKTGAGAARVHTFVTFITDQGFS